MDFNATIDLIIKDLKEASDIIDDLKMYPGVPVLQVELVKLKCKSAGEIIAMLKTMKEFAPAPEIEKVVPKKIISQQTHSESKPMVIPEKETTDEPVVSKTISSQQPLSESKPIPSHEKNSPMVEEEEKDTAPFEIETPVTEAEHVQKKAVKKEENSSILADKFIQPSERVIEKLSTKKSEDDISDIHKTKHLNTLSEAIGVNDKFLFIREIFNGNKNDYIQAIARLESSENITDAKAVIMSYTGENEENEAVIQLLELVKRKLPADE